MEDIEKNRENRRHEANDSISRPESLYKYLTAETGVIVLETCKLRWSSPINFNDPSEFQRIPRFEPSLSQAVKSLPELIVNSVLGKKPLDESKLSAPALKLHNLAKFCMKQGIPLEKLLEEAGYDSTGVDRQYADRMRGYFGPSFINQARVMCLTANPTNSAMWANYSGQHSGCLLGFRHLRDRDTPFQEVKKVEYHDDPPVVGSGTDFVLYGPTKEILRATLDGVCFAKKSDWEYEREWRVVTWRSDERGASFGDYSFTLKS